MFQHTSWVGDGIIYVQFVCELSCILIENVIKAGQLAAVGRVAFDSCTKQLSLYDPHCCFWFGCHIFVELYV